MDALSCGLSKPDIAQAVAEQELSPRELKQVTIDTTVQEKNITHPTDSKLSHRAITKLAKAAKDRGIPLRQTYVRVAKQAAGHTLAQAIASTKANTGVAVTDTYDDKGERDHNYEGEATVNITGSSNRHLTRTGKKLKRRRSAVEPKIGHLKRENRLGRCFLARLIGDTIKVVLAAAGSNLRKFLAALAT